MKFHRSFFHLVICRFFVAAFAASALVLLLPLRLPSAFAASVGAGASQASAKKGSESTTGKEQAEPERGYAAFYSQLLEGHKTACGGTYSSTQLTAAHRKLRCGTKLRVTNLRNGKTVKVTVNDHGPLSGERIIDLSYAAAQALDFVKQGTTLVKIEVLR